MAGLYSLKRICSNGLPGLKEFIYSRPHIQVHLNKLECRGKVHLFQ